MTSHIDSDVGMIQSENGIMLSFGWSMILPENGGLPGIMP